VTPRTGVCVQGPAAGQPGPPGCPQACPAHSGMISGSQPARHGVGSGLESIAWRLRRASSTRSWARTGHDESVPTSAGAGGPGLCGRTQPQAHWQGIRPRPRFIRGIIAVHHPNQCRRALPSQGVRTSGSGPAVISNLHPLSSGIQGRQDGRPSFSKNFRQEPTGLKCSVHARQGKGQFIPKRKKCLGTEFLKNSGNR